MATETPSKTNGATPYEPLLTEEHLRPHQDHALGSVFRQVLDALTCAPKDNPLKHATVVHLRDVRIGRIRVHRTPTHHTTSNEERRGAQPEALALAPARAASLEAGAEGEAESSYEFEDVEVGEVTYLQKPKEPEPPTEVGGG